MSNRQVDPAVTRALLAARDKREQQGAAGDGKVVLEDLTPEEALALDGLLSLSRRKPVLAGATLRVPLSQFEAALRSSGIDPRREYERVGERPVRDLPAERRARLETRAGFRSWLESHEVVRAIPAVAEWLDCAVGQGRVRVEMRPLVEQALRVVSALPASEPVQRTVLAAGMLDGDSHGLDLGTPLHGLTVSLLAASAGLDQRASIREVWAAWNVVVDPVSSNVAVLNLPLLGDGHAASIVGALSGSHAVLTYGQLSQSELRWPPGVACFSCENPSVLIAAEQALGDACPPLVCTGGRPSDAVRLLFSSVRGSNGEIRHHGDFDEAGVQILRDLEERYGAVPWRFDIESLWEALATIGRTHPFPRPSTLEEAVGQLAKPVPEELLLDELLLDLRMLAED